MKLSRLYCSHTTRDYLPSPSPPCDGFTYSSAILNNYDFYFEPSELYAEFQVMVYYLGNFVRPGLSTKKTIQMMDCMISAYLMTYKLHRLQKSHLQRWNRQVESVLDKK
jgi:hypothetical protein